MADIALTTANRVEVVGLPVRQVSWVAGEALVAGAPVTQNASGKAINSDANGVAPINTVQAIALRTVASGESVTCMKEGRIEGYNFTSQAYGAKIFVSDTTSTLADAAGTASLYVGYVEAATANGITAAHDKILAVNIV